VKDEPECKEKKQLNKISVTKKQIGELPHGWLAPGKNKKVSIVKRLKERGYPVGIAEDLKQR